MNVCESASVEEEVGTTLETDLFRDRWPDLARKHPRSRYASGEVRKGRKRTSLSMARTSSVEDLHARQHGSGTQLGRGSRTGEGEKSAYSRSSKRRRQSAVSFTAHAARKGAFSRSCKEGFTWLEEHLASASCLRVYSRRNRCSEGTS